MKKLTVAILVIILLLAIFGIQIEAVDNTFEVSTQEEYITALSEIHNSSNGNFIISLQQDITVDNSSLVTSRKMIDNGNTVTLIGNGHTISFMLDKLDKLWVSNGTLNLGLSDGSDVLKIKGPGEGGATQDSLVTLDNGTVNMYEGVSLSDSHSGSRQLIGCGVRIQTNGTFNMYGGSIKNNASTAYGLGGAVALDCDNGTFNMYDGEITNNSATDWGGAIYAGGIVAGGGSGIKVNILGGKISNNTAPYGGAIANMDCEVTIKNATIENNEGQYGGAVINYSETSTTFILEKNDISSNTATYGGALMNYYGTLTLNKNDITGNNANCGGGIYNNYGTTDMKNNTIKNNTATDGGGIFSEASIISENDEITLNTAVCGGGVCMVSGDADFGTSLVYNNKASILASDYYISDSCTGIKLMDAVSMKKTAEIDGKTVQITGWYKDEEDDRFTLTNSTEIVESSSVTAGELYCLIAAKDGYTVSYDDDGDEATDNVVKNLAKNSKVKIDSNGGVSQFDGELELSDDIIIDNPTKENYIFIGWSEENVAGYDLALKANWKEKGKYTVTFKVANGTWSDGTTANKIITIEEGDNGEAILKISDIPTGMKANTNYKNGEWDETIEQDTKITEDLVFTYTFEKDENIDNVNDSNTDSQNDEISKEDDTTNSSADSVVEQKNETTKNENPTTKDTIFLYTKAFVISVIVLYVLKNSKKSRLKGKHALK